MGRLLAIDFGQKRVGLAVTDPMQIIATPLQTVNAPEAIAFIFKYVADNEVEAIILGLPMNLQGNSTDNTKPTKEFGLKLKRAVPGIKVYLHDERFTSLIANQTMLAAGLGKKARADKGTTDRTSAVIILQSFMESRANGITPRVLN